MDERLKERLTGAVILVAIVVLLVPAMFRGRPPADSAAAMMDAPVQTGPVAPPVLMPAVVAAPAPVPEVVAPTVSPEVPAPSTAPAQAPADDSVKGWVVQVGSFTIRENADRMVRQGAKVGMKLVVAGPDDKGYFRVRSTVQHDRAAALRLQARYQALGFKSLINSAP